MAIELRWSAYASPPGEGHKFLFEAFRGLRRGGIQATLFLVGKGPEEERLRSIAGEMGIAEEVRFLGWRDDALTILAAADVVVHASLQEALRRLSSRL
jgi:glycosyltransferase involved in cell wall biosynthesis